MLLVWCVLAMLVVDCVLWAVRTASISHEEEKLAQVDPFLVLELEHQLAVAAVEVSTLQRAVSAQDLPDEISEISTQTLGDPDARFRRELELGARGWSW